MKAGKVVFRGPEHLFIAKGETLRLEGQYDIVHVFGAAELARSVKIDVINVYDGGCVTGGPASSIGRLNIHKNAKRIGADLGTRPCDVRLAAGKMIGKRK